MKLRSESLLFALYMLFLYPLKIIKKQIEESLECNKFV